MKAQLARFAARRHEPTNCVEYRDKLTVVFTFLLVQPSRKVFVRREHLSEANESPNNFDARFDRHITV